MFYIYATVYIDGRRIVSTYDHHGQALLRNESVGFRFAKIPAKSKVTVRYFSCESHIICVWVSHRMTNITICQTGLTFVPNVDLENFYILMYEYELLYNIGIYVGFVKEDYSIRVDNSGGCPGRMYPGLFDVIRHPLGPIESLEDIEAEEASRRPSNVNVVVVPSQSDNRKRKADANNRRPIFYKLNIHEIGPRHGGYYYDLNEITGRYNIQEAHYLKYSYHQLKARRTRIIRERSIFGHPDHCVCENKEADKTTSEEKEAIYLDYCEKYKDISVDESPIMSLLKC